MIEWLGNGETDKVIHTVETDIVILMVEIESVGKSSDEFDEETGSAGGLQPKQTDLSCVPALNELHSHKICVVPSVNSLYFLGLVTSFSSVVGQMSGPFSTDSGIILPYCLFIIGNPTFSSHTDLTSPKVINPLSGNTASFPDHLLEEFADELALITFSSGNDDLPFDIESDLREIEYLLNHDPTKEMDSILEDLVDKGTSRTYTPAASGSNSGKQIAVICYNCKGEGHISKQCTKPKRKPDDSWFKDKVLLVQAQANGQILHKEEFAFLADPRILEDALAEVHNPDNVNNHMINHAVQVIPSSEQSNVVNHLETKITSDSNIIPYYHYVQESQKAPAQNSNLSSQQDALILSVIEQLKTQVVNYTKINLDNKSVNDTLTAEVKRYKEQVKVLKEGQIVEVKSRDSFLDSHEQNAKIDRLKQTLSKQLQEKESLMKTITVLKNDFKKKESQNIDREIALEKKNKYLDNIVYKRNQSGHVRPPPD
nr:hypothetical protein [Tanacetum cinerariifolium]